MHEVRPAFTALLGHSTVVVNTIQADLQVRRALRAGLPSAGVARQPIFTSAVMTMPNHEEFEWFRTAIVIRAGYQEPTLCDVSSSTTGLFVNPAAESSDGRACPFECATLAAFCAFGDAAGSDELEL